MRRKSFEDMECGIARALETIGDPWSFLIVRDALFGARTFDAFHRNLGIAKNTLSDRLAHLVEVGVLARDQDPEDGRRVTYMLLEKGEELIVVLIALSQWGNKWAFPDTGAPSFVADRKSASPVAQVQIESRNGEALSAADLMMIPGPSASDRLRQAFDDMKKRTAPNANF